MAYIHGLMQATPLQQQAGIMDINGVKTVLFPKAAVRATKAYGVQAARNRLAKAIATFAMRTSADFSFCSRLLRSEVTFILLA